MREIKYRAWDKERNEWQYFTLQELITGQASVIWPHLEHWCQFTGIKDCHGKEIFEGDVVYDGMYEYEIKYSGHSFMPWGGKPCGYYGMYEYEIKYSGHSFMPWGGKPCGYYRSKLDYPHNFTVIGNIWEGVKDGNP